MYVRNKDTEPALPAEGRGSIFQTEGGNMSSFAIDNRPGYGTQLGYGNQTRQARPVRPAARPAQYGVAYARTPMLTRRGRIIVGALIAVPVLAFTYMLGLDASQADAGSTVSNVSLEEITVMPGDTLWTIAAEVAPKADPQQVINELTSLNRLETQTLQPGQHLAIPAKYSD